MAKEETKRAVCEMCHARCRVLVYSKNGRLVKIEEDRSNPLVDIVFPPTRGCLRLRGIQEWFYHPERVNFPLRRAGEKGEGKWQKISWEQAFDEITEKLKEIIQKYGPEAIAATSGTARTCQELESRFFNTLGTPNHAGQGMICYSPAVVTSGAIFGWPLRHRTNLTIRGGDAKPVTKCILAVGVNPSQSIPRLWKTMRDCKKLGVKTIVVDPRKTQTAELADLWLQIRPGTDTALMMSMVNVVIEEELYDRDFVEKWCYGFDKVAERVRDYPPEKVAEITWIPAEKIREAARMFAKNKPAVSMNGMGNEHLSNAIEAIHARLILTAITGNVDVEGSNDLTGPARCIVEAEMALTDALSPEQKAKQIGADRFKLLSWPGHELIQGYAKKVWGKPFSVPHATAEAHFPTLLESMIMGKPYPIKACITIASNPMVTQPNTKQVYKALKNMELYVVLDYWLTPSAELADYVLPIASWLERPFFSTGAGGVDNTLWAGEKALPSAIPSEYDHRTDYEVFREIMMRLGQGQHWPWETLEECYSYRLAPMGMTFEEFMGKGGYDFPPNEYRKYEKIGFATPTGKVELYSTIFEKLGYDPLPRFEEPAESPYSTPELAREYPLILTTGGRFHPMYHSEHRQVDSIRRRHPDPLVQLNPETATKLGINDGDWVWIESPRGRVRMKCQYFDGIDPRVVHAEHGWWFPELPGEEPWLHGVWESNINVVLDNDPDVCNKLSGSWPLKTALCKIYKVKKWSPR